VYINETTTHELGHIFGLCHVNAPEGMMANGAPMAYRFSVNEIAAMHMMFLRKPQSEFVDNERAPNTQWW
jgi:predicted Zn-dependent protease